MQRAPTFIVQEWLFFQVQPGIAEVLRAAEPWDRWLPAGYYESTGGEPDPTCLAQEWLSLEVQPSIAEVLRAAEPWDRWLPAGYYESTGWEPDPTCLAQEWLSLEVSHTGLIVSNGYYGRISYYVRQ